ncbi:MAG: sulfite exporter TauE/SafE family protein [Actinomycetes bacterium]
MTPLAGVAIALAGVGAGAINAVVGSGTLITFPTVLAFGYPAVSANVSNNIGLVPGGVTATWGYRAELEGQQKRLLGLAPLSLLGAVTGSLLLLVLPASAFAAIVPILIFISLVLVLIQPRLQASLLERRSRQSDDNAGRNVVSRGVMGAGVYLAGVYGGYFGAAQGVLLVGILGALLPESLQRINAAKNLLSLVVNAVAAVVFSLVARDHVVWPVVGLIALGSLIGGFLGAKLGRRLPPRVLRGIIVVVGLVAIVKLVFG